MAGDAEPGRVLVVEDELVNRLSLVRGVEREGHAVAAATNGREALEALRRGPFDIVLLDLLMPVLDGFAVLEEMSTDGGLRDVPVLVISAVDDVTSIARAIELGAVDVLPKPFEPVLLRARLRTALTQRRLRRLERAYLDQELALREQERLAAIGRMSAGLAHELNNPAAAALRTARQLVATARDVGEILRQAVGVTVPLPREPLAAADRADLEERLEPVLARYGVTSPWTAAGDLAAAGVRPEDLDATLASAGASADLVARAAAAQLELERSVAGLLGSVERVSGMVDAVRSYSYLDRGEEQDVDVARGLADTVSLLAHRVPSGVSVTVDAEPGLPTVVGSGVRLNQVWTALLDNALDALDGARAGAGSVRLGARSDGGAVVVEVEDDGPGIPPDLLPRVFDPFVTTKEPGHGVGLGLTIARHVVADLHGGGISVESAPGRTVVTVRLPVR